MVKKLFDKWAYQAIMEVTGYSDSFTVLGVPNPALWAIVGGAPTVTANGLEIAPADTLDSVAASEVLYGQINTEIDFPIAFVDKAQVGFNITAANKVELQLDAGTGIATLTCSLGGTSSTDTASFIPNTDVDFILYWNANECYVMISGKKALSVKTNILATQAPVQFDYAGGGVDPFYVKSIWWGEELGSARIQLVRRRRGQVFNEYIDTFQGDAIMHIAEGNALNDVVSIGTLLKSNDITYQVKEQMQPMERGDLVVHRWALYRDLTAPSQVVGVR